MLQGGEKSYLTMMCFKPSILHPAISINKNWLERNLKPTKFSVESQKQLHHAVSECAWFNHQIML
jgi:hypothetical protein